MTNEKNNRNFNEEELKFLKSLYLFREKKITLGEYYDFQKKSPLSPVQIQKIYDYSSNNFPNFPSEKDEKISPAESSISAQENSNNQLSLITKKFDELTTKLSVKPDEGLSLIFPPLNSSNFWKTSSENFLYHMKPNERQQWAEKHQGLERIIADKLLEKVGTMQDDTLKLVVGHTLATVVGVLPFTGMITSNDFIKTSDNLRIEMEHYFSISEVKEIVNQQLASQNQLREEIMKLVMDGERNREQEKEKLLEQIEEAKEQKDQAVKDKEAELSELKSQGSEELARKEKEKTQLESQKLTLETNLTNKETELENTKSWKDDLAKQITQLEKQIETINADKETITQAYNEEASKRQNLEKNIQETADRIKHKAKLPSLEKIDLEVLKTKYQELAQDNELKAEAIGQGLLIVKQKNQDIETYKDNYAKLHDQQKQTLNERNNFERELARTQVSLQSREQTLDRVSKELTSEREQLTKKSQEAHELAKQRLHLIAEKNSQKSELNNQIRELQSELNAEKAQRQLDIDSREREITRQAEWIRTQENNRLAAEQEHEQRRLKLLTAYQTNEQLRASLAPAPWVRTIFRKIDWACGIPEQDSLEIKVSGLWNKSLAYGRLFFLVLILAFFCWLFSWVIRILAAVYRNTKKIFTKKQDTASVLKDFLQETSLAKKAVATAQQAELINEKQEIKIIKNSLPSVETVKNFTPNSEQPKTTETSAKKEVKSKLETKPKSKAATKKIKQKK
jgi:hypothetical protein